MLMADRDVAQLFDPVRESAESVRWTGRPHFVPFLLRGVPLLILGSCWGAFDYFGFIRHMKSGMEGFMIPFFAIHLLPFWGGLGYMLWLLLSYTSTAYALTERHLLFRSGIGGRNFKSVALDQVVSMDVGKGLVEGTVGAGTIRINSGRTTPKGSILYDNLVAVDDPYEVYKLLEGSLPKRA
jgi:uncharacterized membrane protein YdbT with pleckstrin-like domain